MYRKRAPKNWGMPCAGADWQRMLPWHIPLPWVSVSQPNTAGLFSAVTSETPSVWAAGNLTHSADRRKWSTSLVLINMNTPLCIAAQHPLSTAIQQQGRSLWVMEKNQAFICVSGYKSKQAKSRLWINPVLLHIPTVSPVVRQEHLQCPVLQDLGKLHRGRIPFPGSEAPGRQNNFHTSYCSCSRRLSPHLVSGK